MKTNQQGFTLIELLIAVAIVGILTAIAYPSYVDHVKSGKRRQAQADISELAQFMERFYTEKNTYFGATLPFTQSPHSGTADYTLRVTTAAGTPDEFTITATPTGAMTGDKCGAMTINQKGSKSAAITGCW